jgi:cell division septation protein DedD
MDEAKARLAAPEPVTQATPQTMTMEQQAGSSAVGAPIETVASNMQAENQLGLQAPTIVPGYAAAAPILAPQPVATAPTYAATPVAGTASCPATAPVLERMNIQSGGTVLVCTRGAGGAMGWVSPAGGGAIQNILGQQVGYAGSANAHLRQNAAAQYAAPTARYVQTEIAGVQIIAPPIEKTHYVAAWKDDRLNPLRGQGTAEGWAMQAQIWTQKSPMKLVSKQPAAPANDTMRVMQSSMSAPDAGAARYVQVGTFGNAQNVANASGALAAMGLPVTKSAMTKAGRDLVVVLAGPFDNGQAAQQALGMAQQAGFGDAFLR